MQTGASYSQLWASSAYRLETKHPGTDQPQRKDSHRCRQVPRWSAPGSTLPAPSTSVGLERAAALLFGYFLPEAKSFPPSPTLKSNSGLRCLTNLLVYPEFLPPSQVHFCVWCLTTKSLRPGKVSRASDFLIGWLLSHCSVARGGSRVSREVVHLDGVSV